MKRRLVPFLAVTLALSACGDQTETVPMEPEVEEQQSTVALERALAATHSKEVVPEDAQDPWIMNSHGGEGLVVSKTPPTPSRIARRLTGPGVTIQNVSYTGDSRARAAYHGGTGIIGIEAGIILSTGDARYVAGMNTQPGITGEWNRPGNAELTNLIGRPTYDAAVLQFDFVPNGSQIAFEYVFSSEEYNEYVNYPFNDVFAFFVNGVNCALLPDGSPVSINNVNGGNPLGTNATNPHLYRNNVGKKIIFYTEMDGLTVPLVCIANVTPNVVNTMRLAIADAGDAIYDSNVFLKAGSLSTVLPGQISVSPATATVNAGDDHTATVTIRKTDNTPVPGETVELTVGSGPSVGLTMTAVSDQLGQAVFTLTSATGGTDAFAACFDDPVDGATKCGSGTVTWFVPNVPPAADVGGPYTGDEGAAVAFDGTGSSDADAGQVLTYAWDFGDGSAGSESQPSHTYADDGTYSVKLTVTDPFGETSTASTTATIVNVAPTVSVGAMSTELTADPSTGTGSFTDPGADTWTATVNYGDGSGDQPLALTAGNSFALSHAYADDGTYTVTVTVTDDDGGAGTASTTATILNRAPVADASASDAVVECVDNGGITLALLNGTGSSDADGSIVSWSWTGGGTEIGTGALAGVNLTYGSHDILLTVQDDDGATGSATHTVDIIDTTAPTLGFSLDVTELWAPNHQMVTVATGIGASDACDGAPVVDIQVTSNEPLSDIGDGDPDADWAVAANGDGTFDLQLRAERQGPGTDRIYTVTVTATDGAGNTTTSSGTVTVPHDQRGKKGN